ncbi:MAG: hypothetical protein WD276_00865 [Actinomycetota bacterium]
MRYLLIGFGTAVLIWLLVVAALVVFGRRSVARELTRLIPEFIPVAGPIDDAIVALLVLRHLARKTPRNVLLEHWRGNPRTLAIIAGRAAA